MESENNEISLDNTNPTVKNEQHTLNENVINEIDLHQEYNPAQNEERPGLDLYPRQDVPKVD